MIKNTPKVFFYFLGAILVLNLFQSYITPLIYDEAYYWYYAQNMAWGYFDHPPMVALLIKISSFLAPGELGVRAMGAVLSAALYWVLWALIDHPKKKEYIIHFFVLVFSMTLIHAYGFFTLPDTPLLFFTALFLYIYKKFLVQPSYALAIGMGVVMACLMYSKYHAVLVILFVLLSNVKLALNKHAWLAVAIALLCYAPHFYWLYEHDFVSVRYHLFDRPKGKYKFEYTSGFFLNLIAVYGLTFPFMYKALFKTKGKDLYTRALLFLTYGVMVFFFVSSFNRRIQTQWIILICIPMAVLAFNYMLENEKTRLWIYRLGLANIAILLFARIGLVFQPLFPLKYETHGGKEWVQALEEQIGDTPAVFDNSYRAASFYAFYSGHTAFSLNNYMYRKNQYSIDDSEAKVQGKRVVSISEFRNQGDVQYMGANGKEHYGTYIDTFESYRKLEALVHDASPIALGDTQLPLAVYNPYQTDIALSKIKFFVTYLNSKKQPLHTQPLQEVQEQTKKGTLSAQDTTLFTFTLPQPAEGTYSYFRIGISENGLLAGLNGNNVKLE